MEAPPYEVLRIDVSGVTGFDIRPTHMSVEVSCWNGGERVHTILHTTLNKLDVGIAPAICRFMQKTLKVVTTEKLVEKPSVAVEVYVHDLLAYLWITRQARHPLTVFETYVRNAERVASEITVPVNIYLGTPEYKETIQGHYDSVYCESVRVTPTPWQLGVTVRNLRRSRGQR